MDDYIFPAPLAFNNEKLLRDSTVFSGQQEREKNNFYIINWGAGLSLHFKKWTKEAVKVFYF